MLKVRNFKMRGLTKAVLSFALLMSCTVAMAQNKVSGVITDAQGEPLIGVSVVEEGTQNGTTTDINGRYTLDVKRGAKLNVSYIGFAPQTITAGQNLAMQEDNTTLNEVVVVGYGTMRRKDVTSSITTVQSKDLNTGTFADAASMLQGKVAGLVVTSSGNPDGAQSITLRGASSLRSGEAMEPYYVIDGIPGVDISMVAPDDIETIDVLRDASATAIYGSKAANGVIIITTKSGQEGRTNVSYNGYVAFNRALKTFRMATADELRNAGEVVEDYGADTNWQDEVLRTGIAHNHNVAINGGSKHTKYMGSLNYMSNDGVVRGTDMNRINARALLSSTILKDHLTLSVGVNAMQGKHHGVPTGYDGQSVLDAMNYYAPTNPVYAEDGKSWFDMNFGSQNYNPLSMIHEDSNDRTWKRLQFIGKAALKIVDGLVWNANYSYGSRQTVYSYYNSSASQLPYGGSAGKAFRQTRSGNDQTFETYINYDATFAKVHRLGLMAGYTWEERTYDDGFGLAVYDFLDDSLGYNNLKYGNRINGMTDVDSGIKETIRNISFYGRVNYSYDSRYMLQATIRRDGSSVFGKNKRWGTFPSASVAWNIAEEKFMKNSGIDQLKLRAGYGISGNALGFGAYKATSLYGLDPYSTFTYVGPDGSVTDFSKLVITQHGNPDLKWESTAMLNVGLDFAFFGSRLSGTIELYHKKTKDLIWDYGVSPTIYPLGWITANVGEITNKGIELTLNAVPVRTKNFQWQTSLNLSHNKNEVTKLSNAAFSVNYIDNGDPRVAGVSSDGNTMRIMEGQPLGTFWTYEFAGYDEDGHSTYYVHDPETNERTGEVTTDPRYTDKTIVGNAQPKLSYGWNNTLTYKNWSLNAFFQGTIGNKIMNGARAHYSARSLASGGKNVLFDALEDPYFYSDNNYHRPSDRYLENGSYLRLKSVTLSYTFRKLGGWAQDLTLYGTCNNAFTITGYKGIDPEVTLGGLEPGLDRRETFYPQTRSMILGVRINFGGSKAAPAAPKTVYVTDNAELDRLNGEINRLVNENNDLRNRKPEVVKEVVNTKDIVTYPHYVNFGLNETKVSDQENVNLQYVADMIKSVPDKKFSVVGYADQQTGSAERNQQLSKQRAQNVYDILTKQYGVKASQLTTDAKGGVDTMFLGKSNLSRSVIISEVK